MTKGKKNAVHLFAIILRDALKHEQSPAWKSEAEIQAYLGPRPEGARLRKWLSGYPHGPGNTLWSTETSTEARLAAKALRKKVKTPLYLQALQMPITKGEPV